MKLKLGIALGQGLGTAIYEALSHGVSGIDWPRAIFGAVVTFALLLLVPNRWLESQKGTGS